MREQGEVGDDVATTPYHSKVYTDTPATRSPVLTFVLAILILGILTLGALAAIHWFQRRSAKLDGLTNRPLTLTRAVGLPATSDNLALMTCFREADYEEVSQ